MPKKVIAVDADDTLFDENTAVRKFINQTYGFHHTKADYSVTGTFDLYWDRIWKVEPTVARDMYENFILSTYKQDLQPLPDACSVLTELQKDYDLVVITSRDERSLAMTHTALSSHYPSLFQDIHFVALWGNGKKVTKAQICLEIGAQYLIDDNYDHCHYAADAGIEAILFGDYGWNRSLSLVGGITRCKDWQSVRETFRKHDYLR